jgi:E3 ubiquitin-protein ligase UHRF1
VPEGDWYCPECKNDEDEIVAPGAQLKLSRKKSKMPSHTNRTKRDWGNGMATAGRTKSCTKVCKPPY